MPDILAGNEKAVDDVGYQSGLQPDAYGSGLEVLASADRPRLPFNRGQSDQWGQHEDQVGEQSDGGQFSRDLKIRVMGGLLPVLLGNRVDVKIAHSNTDYRMTDCQVYAAFQHFASSQRRT